MAQRKAKLIHSHGESSSLYDKLIFRYASFALIACLGIGFLLLILSAVQQNTDMLEQEQNSITLAETYLNGQMEIAEDIADSVATNILYQPVYFGRDISYEQELVKDLSKYQGYSPIVRNVILSYDHFPETVYAETHKSFTKVFFERRYMIQDTGRFLARIKEISSVRLMTYDETPDMYYIVCMLRFTGMMDHSGDAHLILSVPVDKMMDRVEQVSGIPGSRIQEIRCNGECIYSDGTANIAASLSGESDGAFQIVLHRSSLLNRKQFIIFCAIGLAVIIASAVILTVYAIVSAKRNYQPLGELMTRYHLPQENEINQIDHLLETLHKTNETAQYEMKGLVEELDTQTKKVREYLYLAILGGTMQKLPAAHPDSLAIRMDCRLYCVFVFYLPAYGGDKYTVTDFVDSASDCKVHLSAVGIGNNSYYAVIAGSDDLITLLKSADMLHEMLESTYHEVVFCVGSIVHDINDCSLSLQSTFASLYEKTAFQPADLNNEEINRMLETAESGNEEEAMKQFDAICDLSSILCPVANMRQALLIQVGNVLNELARSYEAEDRSAACHQALLSGNFDQYKDYCHRTVQDIAAAVKKQEQGRTALRQQIIDYISQNVCDQELTLNAVADKFSLSARQVERYMREEFETSFKDYVTLQKMEIAKKMLLQGKTVSETSTAIGYGNVAYFIKRFRENVGVTPGKYTASFEVMKDHRQE